MERPPRRAPGPDRAGHPRISGPDGLRITGNESPARSVQGPYGQPTRLYRRATATRDTLDDVSRPTPISPNPPDTPCVE